MSHAATLKGEVLGNEAVSVCLLAPNAGWRSETKHPLTIYKQITVVFTMP
jgi:hypothetical protein